MSEIPLETAAARDSQKTTILVVEDEVLIRFALSDELRRAGHTVLEAAHGEEALTILRSPFSVDVVVTDLRMPFMDGAALVRAVQSEFPHVRVIMVAAELPPPEIRPLVEAYISKPVWPRQLAEQLQELINEQKDLQPDHRNPNDG